MKKWLFRFVLTAILGFSVWYFFLKEYHYRVSFTTSQPPGVVYQHLLDWNSFDESDQEVTVISKEFFSKIEQRIISGDSSFNYQWTLKPAGRSKTKVVAYITDTRNNFNQKIQIPFLKNDFVKSSIKNVKLAGDMLLKKAEVYKVHSIKDTVISPLFCAYVPVESRVDKKAGAMLKNIGGVMDYINKNNLKLISDPFLVVTEWDIDSARIKFDFCFPIAKSDSLPASSEVKFKTTSAKRVLKAEFNGNYRNSSNAWYYLLDYADRNKYQVETTPIEYFLNDPHEGGNPLKWKALIFLPLKE